MLDWYDGGVKLLALIIIGFQTLSPMKKIRYGNKKFEAENRALENLKEGDEICEAVLDTFSDDYLSYITHLVKNSKTPNKNIPQKLTENNSSDDQPSQKWPKELYTHLPKTQHSQVQTKARRHSEASAKISTMQRESQFKKCNKTKNESLKVSPKSRGEAIEREQQAVPKYKKRKIEYVHNESILKNQQKTMQFSRNTVQNTKLKDDREIDYDRDPHKKSRITHKSRDNKYYVTSQNYEDTDQEPSINIPLKKERKYQDRPNQQTFIDNINQYITTLEENESVSVQYNSKKESDDEKQRIAKKSQKTKKHRLDEDDYDIQDIFKENLKLSKKVKNYEEKISELDEEISNHLNQCKNREKTYKSKINYLLRGLIQAFMKIDAQQAEISTLKDLHRTYGQKVKQVENKYDDDDVLEDIREEIFKNLAPKRHSSEIRTKHKKVLQSTLPKYDEDRRFW